LLCSGTAA
jgi:hypothetical protein